MRTGRKRVMMNREGAKAVKYVRSEERREGTEDVRKRVAQ